MGVIYRQCVKTIKLTNSKLTLVSPLQGLNFSSTCQSSRFCNIIKNMSTSVTHNVLISSMHEHDKWSMENLGLEYDSMSDMEEEDPNDGDSTNDVELHLLKKGKKLVHHYHKHLLTNEEERKAFRSLPPYKWFAIAQKGTKRKRKLVERFAPRQLTGKSTLAYHTITIIDY